MLDAAAELFLEKGYSATSLNDIVARSGGSMATLYDLFSNKQGLLRAIIEERCAAISEAIGSAAVQDHPPAEALYAIAERLFDRLSDADGGALFRLVVAESPTCPEVGRLFYAAGPEVARRKIAEYLSVQAKRGVLVIDDSILAADIFLQIVFTRYQMQLLCNLLVVPSEEEKRKHISTVVEVFLRIYRSSPVDDITD